MIPPPAGTAGLRHMNAAMLRGYTDDDRSNYWVPLFPQLTRSWHSPYHDEEINSL